MGLPAYIEAHRTDTVRRYAFLLKLSTPTRQCLTDADLPVVYGGATYSPSRALEVSNLTWASSGSEVVSADVEIGNGDAAFGILVSGFVGTNRSPAAVLYLAWFDAAAQDMTVQAAHRLIVGRCDSPSWDSSRVTFSIVPPADGAAEKVPFRVYGTSCTYRKFKGGPCGYTGPAASCDRSYASCTALGNASRFGGFRYMPADGQRFQLNATTAITLERRTDE